MEAIVDIGFTALQSVRLDDENSQLVILDQTLLPNEKKFIKLSEQKDIWDAIYKLKVRGAPAIGIAAAYGAYLGVKNSSAVTIEGLFSEFLNVKEHLGTSRPTA